MDKPLYKPFKSKVKGKKMSVYVKKNGKVKLIHFGDSRYRHNYSKEARENYLRRSAGIRDKEGNLTRNNKNTANYWSRKVLWKA
jgi:TFIIF-interacting CTD phosphatase-like protein